MSTPAPVPLADRILAAIAEKPRTELALRAVFAKVHPDALHIKLVELQRAGRVQLIEGNWRLTPGTNAADSVERVQSAAKAAKREPLPPPPLDPGPIVIQQLRTCSHCHVEKPLSEYHKAPNGKDGRRGDCKQCCIERTRKWQERKRARSEAAVERLRAATPPPAEPVPEPPAPVAEAPAAPPPAEPEPARAVEPPPSSTILQFPGVAREPPKSLEDVVNRHRVQVRVTDLKHVAIADPVTGVHQIVLSPEGLKVLREQLASL